MKPPTETPSATKSDPVVCYCGTDAAATAGVCWCGGLSPATDAELRARRAEDLADRALFAALKIVDKARVEIGALRKIGEGGGAGRGGGGGNAGVVGALAALVQATNCLRDLRGRDR